MSPSRLFLVFLTSQLLSVIVKGEWNCSPESKYCFYLINSSSITWDTARSKCSELGGDLPGAEHMNERNTVLKRGNIGPFWTSLCFREGHLQWLGVNRYEERHLPFFDKLLPDLTSRSIVAEQLYCFYATPGWPDDSFGNFKLALKSVQHESHGICAVDRRDIYRLAAPPTRDKLLSATITAEGTDIDWGPIGYQRDGFINLPRSKYKTLKLKCEVKSTDPAAIENFYWLRNGGYMGVSTQEIDFTSEEDLTLWAGTITCEATKGLYNEAVRSQSIHLTLRDTVTIRIITNCVACQIQGVVESSKIILTQFVENEIRSGGGQEMQYFNEPPIINRTSISIILHLINKRVDKFDYKMAQKLGHQFDLSGWAKRRSLLLPNGSDLRLELISPCNMALPQDRQNVSWIGYPGQIVPSGNIIDGPICVDRQGDVITRSCSSALPNRYQECAEIKSRDVEPMCFPGFEYWDGKCWRMTEETNFASAFMQCSAGRKIPHQHQQQDSVTDWIQNAVKWFARHRSTDGVLPVVWMPLRRFGIDSSLQPITWNWKSGSNRWLLGDTWNATEESESNEKHCAAFNLETKQLILESCQKELPAICSRPALPQPISVIVRNQFDHIGEYYCPPGWITHLFVMQNNLCYRQVTVRQPVTWDDADKICKNQGGSLAIASTNALRIVVEHVYAYFNNVTTIESWIGLRSRTEGSFVWINGEHSEAYNWDPYNDFGQSYGVSMGNRWKSWPRSVKLFGFMCEQSVPDWRNGLHLKLEASTGQVREGNYSITFTYDPHPTRLYDEVDDRERTYETIEIANMNYRFAKKFFWPTEFDVLCYFANEVLHFRIPAGYHRRYQTSINVPDNVGPTSLTCEGWLNQPAVRFQSNTIVHRPANVYAFVLLVAKQKTLRSTPFANPRRLESNDDDLRRRLSINTHSRILRDVISRASVSSTIKTELAYDIQLIHYKLSFFLPPNVHLMDLKNDVRACQNGPAEYITSQSSDIDFEALLLLLLKSCLPSVYQPGDSYQLIEIRSTVACPAETPFALPDQSMPNLQVHHLSWPRTDIGMSARPQQICMIDEHLVHRICQGNFETGAVWGPVQARDETIGDSKTCYNSNSATKYNSLERAARSTDPEAVLDELIVDWKDKQANVIKLEKTIAILKKIVSELRASLPRPTLTVKVVAVIDKMVYPNAAPLQELQFHQRSLEDFVSLLSEVPVLDMHWNRVERNFGAEVTTVAERTDFSHWRTNTQYPPTYVQLSGVSVNITKDFGNFGNKPSLLAIVTSLPAALLTLDPATNGHDVNVYKRAASDPNQAIVAGLYVANPATVKVELQTEPKTTHLTSPLTLTFKAEENGNDVVCARWEPHANGGAWFADGCWFLGRDHSGSYVCQCNSPGIFGLFHSQVTYYAKLRSAFTHRLPVIVNVALFVAILIGAIVRACFVFQKAVQEMDLVEMGVRLEMIAAWTGMLIFHLSQTFLAGYTVECAALATMTQFFLLAAFMLLCMLPILRYWQIHERWITCQGLFLVKTSFAIWGLATIIFISVPLYKLKNMLDALSESYGCWLEGPDFGLTLAIVIVGVIISVIVHAKNVHDQRDLSGKCCTLSDSLSLVQTLLMGTAGLLAVINNSWFHDLYVAIAFGAVSGILGIWWIVEFWVQVPSPVIKHDFSQTAAKLSRDLQLKKVYGSSY